MRVLNASAWNGGLSKGTNSTQVVSTRRGQTSARRMADNTYSASKTGFKGVRESKVKTLRLKRTYFPLRTVLLQSVFGGSGNDAGRGAIYFVGCWA